jgi:mannose-6-phosphate isomerase-like protein (cupin superfamily)
VDLPRQPFGDVFYFFRAAGGSGTVLVRPARFGNRTTDALSPGHNICRVAEDRRKREVQPPRHSVPQSDERGEAMKPETTSRGRQKGGLPGIEVADHGEPGYRPLVRSAGDWMAAMMNGTGESWAVPEQLESHPLTDELFVLLAGRALMVAGGSGESPADVAAVEMEQGRLYNVKAGVWHWTPMTPDAKLLIVEKTGTDADGTTRYAPLTPEQRAAVQLPEVDT